MGKFYAVRKGKNPGIYKSWPACQQQVKGYSGAVYKSFTTLEDAQNFLNGQASQTSQTSSGDEVRWLKKVKTGPVDSDKQMLAYVDGSFDKRSGYFGYGGVILYQGNVSTFKGGRNTVELAKMRNVAGEIIGAMQAVKIAIEQEADEIIIYHDYLGIAEWALAGWQAKNQYTKEYQKFMQEKSQNINIAFVKVAAHTGDKYNEQADQLAKAGIQEVLK